MRGACELEDPGVGASVDDSVVATAAGNSATVAPAAAISAIVGLGALISSLFDVTLGSCGLLAEFPQSAALFWANLARTLACPALLAWLNP